MALSRYDLLSPCAHDDPLAGLLSDEEQDAPKKPAPADTKSSSEKDTEQSKEKEPPQMPLHTVAPVQRRDLMFEDDGDDLMDALGFGSGPKGDQKEELWPARSMMDELVGQGAMDKILKQPGKGEHREFKLDKKYQNQPEKEDGWDKEDFDFGAYRPTMASTPNGQLGRRQSVSRFSAETSSEAKPEPCHKPPPASQNPLCTSRNRGDWLGLKDEAFMGSELSSPVKTSPAVSHPSSATARQHRSTSQLLAAEKAAPQPDLPEEEQDWLMALLAHKKAQAQAKTRERNVKLSEAPSKALDPQSPVRQPVSWLSTTKQGSTHPLESVQGDPSGDASALVPTAAISQEQKMPGPAMLTQAESAAPGLLHERRLGAPTSHLYKDASGYHAELLRAQAHVAELESQVQMLEMERTQYKLMLESLQQRHQADLDHLESTYRSRMKMLEDTYGQQEERLRRKKELLVAQLVSQSQDAAKAQAELVAQHEERVAALEQQRMQDLERVRELQRTSVQEMRKDYEEQLQRLKRLKDLEIDAVTSATSHTRSLNGIIEQMEKFSSDLHDLSHKVEATHQTTSQELAQQRDKQLKVLEDRLSQQQKDMEEERSRLQEVITRMESRLSEQSRLLEQERSRLVAEQSKVELLQHSLEEQRRGMTQQLSMERAELEREKSALLEERQKLERDMDRTLQMASQRESSIMSLAKEQAELKIRSHELKAKENHLLRGRELLEEAWQELRHEKEKVNRATLRIQHQEEEIKSMTNLSSQKYEEGERALREARRVESEHQSRLQVMQQHLEQLKQQEQRLHQANTPTPCLLGLVLPCQGPGPLPTTSFLGMGQERLSMARQRRQLEQLREVLPRNPMTLRTTGEDLSAPIRGLSATLPEALRNVPGFLPPIREALSMASPTEFYIKLLLLNYRAQQDHRFLEDEQFFLDSLKKAPYNT
ncbi:fas-binding factor 1 homolog isoform X3 [Strigops habroptila]|uniref:fas-binding factor 1 homolog isoform X3 n=1 Tax=Strigops habroptila TaxID=2489341 RepID=UPI0011CEFF46|nr:fas-binding factor 1 homolog isoform X3 [Strigops habroptila]